MLFVYGTLMHDGPRAGALAGLRCLGPARTQPLYDLLDLGTYPGLVRFQGEGRSVLGELYEVPHAHIAVLDEIEAAPALFQLERIHIEDVAGPAFAYFYQPAAAGVPRYSRQRWDNRRNGEAR
jgi:gamma-glutamylcyclotransferase (GGCT)/AIG2-like uncharacterized protein YtfP